MRQRHEVELKGPVQRPPDTSGIGLANWHWKIVRQFVIDRFSVSLTRSSCPNYLRHLGSAFKRPRKRLAKTDGAKLEALVTEDAALSFHAIGHPIG